MNPGFLLPYYGVYLFLRYCKVDNEHMLNTFVIPNFIKNKNIIKIVRNFAILQRL